RPLAGGYSAWFLRSSTLPPKSGASVNPPLLAAPGTPLLVSEVHSPRRNFQSAHESCPAFCACKASGASNSIRRSNILFITPPGKILPEHFIGYWVIFHRN